MNWLLLFFLFLCFSKCHISFTIIYFYLYIFLFASFSFLPGSLGWTNASVFTPSAPQIKEYSSKVKRLFPFNEALNLSGGIPVFFEIDICVYLCSFRYFLMAFPNHSSTIHFHPLLFQKIFNRYAEVLRQFFQTFNSRLRSSGFPVWESRLTYTCFFWNLISSFVRFV